MTAASLPDTHPASEAGGRRSILGNFRSVVVGRLFASFSMWLALIVLAKLSDPATVGIYALAQAICVSIAEVARLGLRESLASDTQGTYRFGSYLALRLLATVVALALMLAIGLLQTNAPAVLFVVLLYALTRCLELVSDMIHGLFQAHERMDRIGWSLCLLGPLSLVLLSVGYWATGSLLVAVLGQLVAQAVVLAFYDLPMGQRLARTTPEHRLLPIWDGRALASLAWQALPLALATILVMVAIYLPRLAVERSMGLAALGVFAALTALAMAPSRLVASMGIAASVRLAQHHAAGDTAGFLALLGRLVLPVASLGALGVVVAAGFGDAILRSVYSADYAAHGDLFVWLVAAATLRCVADVVKFGNIASRRFWWLTAQYGVVALTALIACASLIPPLGLTGAGIAVFLTFASQLLTALIGLACSLPRIKPMVVPA